MFRLNAILEKSIREGNVTEAVDCVTNILRDGYSCQISLVKRQSNPIVVNVNVFSVDMRNPITVKINAYKEDSFDDIKRKVCGELSIDSPYQQKLFVCGGASTAIEYEFPSNTELIGDYFKTEEDFKLNPICIFVTQASPSVEFQSECLQQSNSKWACSSCSFHNSPEIINCLTCGAMK